VKKSRGTVVFTWFLGTSAMSAEPDSDGEPSV
jgi:hypothetical protein